MTIKEIVEKSGLKVEVAESVYYKCLWIRDASPDTEVSWYHILRDKKYRLTGKIKKDEKGRL